MGPSLVQQSDQTFHGKSCRDVQEHLPQASSGGSGSHAGLYKVWVFRLEDPQGGCQQNDSLKTSQGK